MDVDEIKQRIALYFDTQTMKPLRPNVWFNIQMVDLFDEAFEKLPVLKRIWIRLTGKYEAFRSSYLGRSVTTGTGKAAGSRGERDNAGNGSANGNGDRTRTPRSDASRAGGTGAADGRSARTPRTAGNGGGSGASSRKSGSTARAAAPAPVRRPPAYNKRQQDSAWDTFQKTIKKDD